MTKAVIVGINRYPQAPLHGCVNDAEDVINYLTDVAGFARSDIYPLSSHNGLPVSDLLAADRESMPT